ncbi:hypothetical protein D9613_004226 [Agrocybe pediades]|uniref:H/ACA ribonucleoprotein complex non-core subunit NAF1 n=1 Tax=Agrocybe pediades TaxID=84607 RepID=A0A8H4VJ56_9AGAR|nr:hypothetical protein D9613_004226 [Agrocybe pediades]
MDTDGFKVPHSIPQDLLLIQELIGAAVPGPSPASASTMKSAIHGAPLSPTTNVNPPVMDMTPKGASTGHGVEEDIGSSDDEGGPKEKVRVKSMEADVVGDSLQTKMDVDVDMVLEKEETIVQKTRQEMEDDEDAASEEEIAADLIEDVGDTGSDDERPSHNASKIPATKEEITEPALTSSDSSSDSSSSESSSSDSESDDDDEESTKPTKNKASANDDDNLGLDEDDGPLPSTSGYFTTKHEVPETEAPITVPDVTEVGSDEVLEKVGEVMNVVESTKSVIVRGLLTDDPTMSRASDRALDSETLLVFEDRKVLGYIYETFGPTTQPFYLIKFSTSFPLDPALVTAGRAVFHVPNRSKFVFVSQIKAIKGSDASNVHDEEPGDDELEFSDDEKEAEWRARLKRKRGESRARSSSVVSSYSRQATPNPTQMRDQELASSEREEYISQNPYDEHGPYDMDYPTPRAGPSSLGGRTPVPYDDPYSEEYTAPDVDDREKERASVPSMISGQPPSYGGNTRGRGRGRDRERVRGRGRERERGRGGGGGGGGAGRGGRGSGGGRYANERHSRPFDASADAYDNGGATGNSRNLSPTSVAIARATGTGYGYGGQSHAYGARGYSQEYVSSGGYEGQGQYRAPPQQQQQHHFQQQPHYYGDSQSQIPGLRGYVSSRVDENTSSWQYAQTQLLQNMFNSQYPYQQQQPHQHQGYGMGGTPGMSGSSYGGIPGGQHAGVQPHINPRFAFNFGAVPIPSPLQTNSSGTESPAPSAGAAPYKPETEP